MPIRTSRPAAVLLLLAAPAAAQQRASTQAEFDAATALDAGVDRAAALAAWERLEARPGLTRRTRAVVRARKSLALFMLDRADEAIAAARAGLADMPAGDQTLREDRFQAHMTLGRIAESAIDFASAADDYARAEALADSPAAKIAALSGLAATQTFNDPAAAAAALDRADRIIAANKVAPAVQATFARRRGLLLLNTGDLAGARAQTARAVKLLGGLTLRLDTQDVSARNDAALALLLAGQAESAREYLAYTGAGRFPKGEFNPGTEMIVPDCGGEAGLKPADMAVIEFTVGTDGRVLLATPIYAAGGPEVALEFARAAANWSWQPEQVAKMPNFFRYRARVEMRCSTGFERPSTFALLRSDLAAWATANGTTLPSDEGSEAAAAPRHRAAVAGASSGPALVVALARLAENATIPREERHAAAARALSLAGNMPATARLGVHLHERYLSVAEGWDERGTGRLLTPLLSDPAYAADPRARAALSLVIADAAETGTARLLLGRVQGDAALARNDPFRVGAAVRLASLEHAAGDAAAARAAFEGSGLAPSQCAIVDKAPKLVRVGGTFPTEAQRWGFEGWTQTQFDVAADGRVLNERAILAYPPFVFSQAGAKTIAGARFEKSFRPDGGLGCGAQTTRVRFQLPG